MLSTEWIKVEEPDSVLRLVRLEMPIRCHGAMLPSASIFSFAFLHPVLAEAGGTGFDRFADAVKADGLGDRHQPDRRRVPSRATGRGGDAVLDRPDVLSD